MYFSVTEFTQSRPKDCKELYDGGQTVSGVYAIYPWGESDPTSVNVYCDMVTSGGSWTVSLDTNYSTNYFSNY
jgi:hypothetical protein